MRERPRAALLGTSAAPSRLEKNVGESTSGGRPRVESSRGGTRGQTAGIRNLKALSYRLTRGVSNFLSPAEQRRGEVRGV